MLKATGSSEVSIPRAFGVDANEVVGGGGDGALNEKSKQKIVLSPKRSGTTEEPSSLTPGTRVVF